MELKQNQILIEKVENGYIVKHMTWSELDPSTEDGHDKYSITTSVIENAETKDTEDINLTDKCTFVKLVEYLQNDCLEIQYDKWSKNNIQINCNLVGHKVEVEDERSKEN